MNTTVVLTESFSIDSSIARVNAGDVIRCNGSEAVREREASNPVTADGAATS